MKNPLKSRYFLPFLGALGLLLGIVLVIRGGKPKPVAQPVAQPAQAPFEDYIAGSGILEARTRNVAISAPVGGVIAEVLVHVGEQVNSGRPLFRLDSRELEAQLLVRQAAVQSARRQVGEVEVSLIDAREQLERAMSLTDPRAMSAEERTLRRNKVEQEAARLATAQANVESAAAQLREIQTDISRRIVLAPMTGEILQVNVRPGEYAATGELTEPLILMGNTNVLNARVDVDENDAWRFRSGTRGRGFLRGNTAIAFDLKYEYFEPYVVPKVSLTGAGTERVDTRVLQVVFSVSGTDLPIYAGQQVDVYIETPATRTARQDAVHEGKH